MLAVSSAVSFLEVPILNTARVGQATDAMPPTVARAAAAGEDGIVANLSVLGADPGGEASLTYSWSATGPSPVIFTANNSNAAKNTLAFFTSPGNYTFSVAITNSRHQTATSSASVYLAVPPPGNLSVFTGTGTGAAPPASAALPLLNDFRLAIPSGPPLSVGGAFSSKGRYTTERPDEEGSTAPSRASARSSTAATGQANALAVRLSTAFNRMGIVRDGSTFADGKEDGYALSADLLGRCVAWDNQTFALGPAGANNVVQARGQTIGLPPGKFAALTFLAAAVGGNRPNLTFTVTYTDGTRQTFTQSFSDWSTPQDYRGEFDVVLADYRDTARGTMQAGRYHLYAYRFALVNSKTVQSVTLPADGALHILAMNLTEDRSPPERQLHLAAAGLFTVGIVWREQSGPGNDRAAPRTGR